MLRLRPLLPPLLVFALAPIAFAEDVVVDPNQALGVVQQEMTVSSEVQQRIAAEIEEAQRDQDAISAKLAQIAKTIQEQQRDIAEAESAIPRLRTQEIVIRSELAEKQEKLSALLAGLQRLEMNPPPALVVEPRDVVAALRGAMMFGAIVPEMREDAKLLANKLETLQTIRHQTQDKRQQIISALETLRQSEQEMVALMERKKEMLATGTSRLLQEQQKAAALASKAKDLQQLIAVLAETRAKQEQERARELAAEEAERMRQAELAARPRIAFTETRGRLSYPAQGQIIRRFGDSDGLGGKLYGFAVATSSNAQVTAPADAKVEFSGPFRSYGQLLILDAGSDYRLLLAGMDKITVGVGQTLRAGEPVGAMGGGPSSITLIGDRVQEARPVLYIELRKGGVAVDSAPWWIGGMREASK